MSFFIVITSVLKTIVIITFIFITDIVATDRAIVEVGCHFLLQNIWDFEAQGRIPITAREMAPSAQLFKCKICWWLENKQ